jgi:XTP/dITP diphosphohydrolase
MHQIGSMSRKLLLATTNPGKLREVQAILAGLPIDLVTLRDFPSVPEAVEDGETFDDNARRKALHYARHTGLWTLADDSGLEVDALGGAPGVYSARYAGVEACDADNNAKLIAALEGVSEAARSARFRCCIAVAIGDRVVATSFGAIEGRIVDQPRGSNGFGYDPHFFVAEHGMTAAEMPPELKNSISHRARALQAVRPRIEQLIANAR